jgi:hypothetical protein
VRTAGPFEVVELRVIRMVEHVMNDVLYVALSLAVFAVLALVARGVERL